MLAVNHLKPKRKLLLVSPLRCLAHWAVDQGAFAILQYRYPPPGKRIGSLLTLSKLHLISFNYYIQQIDCIVTSAGGIEEDFIKCLAPTFIGDFALKGSVLYEKGLNRIGNLIVPNDNYCAFENWLTPILNQMLDQQKTQVSGYWSWINVLMIYTVHVPLI